jgi:Zn-dependent metalloprotease
MMETDNPIAGCGETASLARAEADLAAATTELATAERDVAKAEAEIKEAIEKERHQFEVKVLYNGVKKPFEVRLEEKVAKLREQAISTFGPITNPHLLGLFKDGKELKDTDTIKEAGVKPCDELLLRPSEVRGGA